MGPDRTFLSRLRRLAAAGAVATLCSLTPAPATAADWTTWQRYMEWAEQAWEQGRLSGAEQRLQDALHEAERQDPNSPQMARTLTALAEVYRKQGRLAEAQALAPRIAALAAAARSRGPGVIEHLQAYATLLRELRRDVDARAVDARIQRLREVEAGDGRGHLLFFNPVAELREYAGLLRQRQRDSEARAVEMLAAAEAARMIQRYETLRRGYGAASGFPSLTWVQQLAAGQEALEGRLYPEAEGLFRDAATTAAAFGPQDARLALTLSLLALVVRAQGRHDEFTQVVQRVRSMLERIAGTGHHLLPRSLMVLAQAHLSFAFDGREALPHLQRSLALLEKAVRADHPVVGLHLAGLAAAHLELGQAESAGPLLERAIAIARAQSAADDVAPAVGLLTVARIYRDRGEYARADAVVEHAVALFRRTLDPDHPDLVFAQAMRRELQGKVARPAPVVSLTGATRVPLELAGNALLVRGVVNRSQGALLLVDTGASTTAVRPLLLQRLGVAIPPDAPRRRMTVVGGETVEVPFVALSVRIGDALIENLDVGVVEVSPGDPDLDGLLGADFLHRFRVVIERSERRLTLEPVSR